MNRDELEAVVRQQITRILTAPAGTAITTVANRATDAILRAADLYRPAPAADPQAARHRAELAAAAAEVWGGNI